MEQVYPFGSPLKKVEQQDKTPKKVFVLGVYASAVHAKWIGADGKIIVKALAVASEPCIFWPGDKSEAAEIIDKISLPSELGKLEPADEKFNGPSGKVLDENYLQPLGLNRDDVWFCDLLPYSRINPNQQRAIETHYRPLMDIYNLPECTIPVFNPAELKNQTRLDEILVELEQSQADTILLLGDLPIKYFLSYFSKFNRLSDFGKDFDEYGKPRKIEIAEKTYIVKPLAHPRQVGELGRSNSEWHERHMYWESMHRIMSMMKIWKGIDIDQVTKKPVICPICHGRVLGTYVNEMPAMSNKIRRDLKKGKIIIREGILSKDDPKYFCVKCKFDFFEIEMIEEDAKKEM